MSRLDGVYRTGLDNGNCNIPRFPPREIFLTRDESKELKLDSSLPSSFAASSPQAPTQHLALDCICDLFSGGFCLKENPVQRLTQGYDLKEVYTFIHSAVVTCQRYGFTTHIGGRRGSSKAWVGYTPSCNCWPRSRCHSSAETAPCPGPPSLWAPSGFETQGFRNRFCKHIHLQHSVAATPKSSRY